VLAEDITTVLGVLDERRANLTTQRTRLINQLHAVFRDVLPGGAPQRLTAAIASALLAATRPVGPDSGPSGPWGRSRWPASNSPVTSWQRSVTQTGGSSS
jgi:hypothetical protein